MSLGHLCAHEYPFVIELFLAAALGTDPAFLDTFGPAHRVLILRDREVVGAALLDSEWTGQGIVLLVEGIVSLRLLFDNRVGSLKGGGGMVLLSDRVDFVWCGMVVVLLNVSVGDVGVWFVWLGLRDLDDPVDIRHFNSGDDEESMDLSGRFLDRSGPGQRGVNHRPRYGE